MSRSLRNRIVVWTLAIGIAVLFLLISKKTAVNPNLTKILVNAPEPMVTAFQNTFDTLKLDKDYIIETTSDIAKANFVVREGMNHEGKLIAYSPIVAVFNMDEEYYKSLIEREYFVTSETDSNANNYDFDFNKIVLEAISEKGCEFKVYYPSKDSDSWEEFYHFMLFNVNDGYYPGTVEEMAQAKQTVEKFLSSKYAEPFNNNTIERSNGIAKNSIYFMAYADLVRVYKQSGGFACRIMYPKTVVYHSYYATYDELGKLIYESLDADSESFYLKLSGIDSNIGYRELRNEGYNTRYSISVYGIGTNVYGRRSSFNGVEIPRTDILSSEEAK